MNRDACDHERVPTPELARPGEVVEFCPTCARHYASRVRDPVVPVVVLVTIGGAVGFVTWVLLGGIVR